jgi:GNAT superfamily N-acetyltransferase
VGISRGRWNLKIRKTKRRNASPKESNGLGRVHFIHDRYGTPAIHDEPDEYVRPVCGRVKLVTDVDDDNPHKGKGEQETVVGRFDASYLNIGNALVARVKIYDVLDASSEIREIYATLFNPDTERLREDVEKLLGGVTLRNILVVNRVEILPAYRGMGLGLAMMWHLIQRHSAGCGIVALKAFPVQFRAGHLSDPERSDWNRQMGYDPYTYTVEFAHERVIFHLKKLGFEPIGNAGVMALSTAFRHPIPKEIQRWVPRSVRPKSEQP